MRTLYESILDIADDDVVDKLVEKNVMIQLAMEIINSSTEFPLKGFLEDNGLILNKGDIEKIAKKLAKEKPVGASFGVAMVSTLKKQIQRGVEDYRIVRWTDPKFAVYEVSLDYAVNDFGPHRRSMSSIMSHILLIYEDKMIALDTPETKSMLKILDEHFSRYKDMKHDRDYKELGDYREYSYSDITKQFVVPEIIAKRRNK